MKTIIVSSILTAVSFALGTISERQFHARSQDTKQIIELPQCQEDLNHKLQSSIFNIKEQTITCVYIHNYARATKKKVARSKQP